MCDHTNEPGGREAAMTVVERDPWGTPTVWCDPCLAPLVSALNAGGVKTVASCCGHGRMQGSIALSDGRWLIVASEEPEPCGAIPREWLDHAEHYPCERPRGHSGDHATDAMTWAEPQGVPSDAQVEAEANDRWPHTPEDPNVASARSARRLSFRQGASWMRVALRAAGVGGVR